MVMPRYFYLTVGEGRLGDGRDGLPCRPRTGRAVRRAGAGRLPRIG